MSISSSTHPDVPDPRSRFGEFKDRYDHFVKRNFSLNLTRGKPSKQQLDLSNGLLTLPGEGWPDIEIDPRNYGGLDGLIATKQLFAGILQVDPDNVIVGGNSSLNMMFDTLSRACLFGVAGGDQPWSRLTTKKFLCPTPGYDRHFLITEHLGFELVPVGIDENGPDMDQVEALAQKDHSIKGIWCVPKYSNPTGSCYSDETVSRLAAMSAAPDFRIMWDNAYAEHHLTDTPPALGNILEACTAAEHGDRVVEFASTSKISYPGAGVAALAASEKNIADFKRHLNVQTIGPDKMNQLRHLALFKDINGLRQHMEKHKALVKPKFDCVQSVLESELAGLNIARWTRPKGGYFISLDIPDGYAKRVIELAAKAGVALTNAGAPFPYGIDPRDRNIRIAPTFPPLEDVKSATEVLATCVKLAVSEASC